MFRTSARMNPLTSGSAGQDPEPMPTILPPEAVTQPSRMPSLSETSPSAAKSKSVTDAGRDASD